MNTKSIFMSRAHFKQDYANSLDNKNIKTLQNFVNLSVCMKCESQDQKVFLACNVRLGNGLVREYMDKVTKLKKAYNSISSS